jgi:hypothetical protein
VPGVARKQGIQVARRVKETVRGQQHGVRVIAGGAGQRREGLELILPQRAPGLREQSGHRHDVLAEAEQPGIGPVPGGDAAGGLQGVQPPAANLVGPREHGDRVEAARPGHAVLTERLQELEVGGVQVAHQVDDPVSTARLVLRQQKRRRPLRVLGRHRRDPRRVDQRGGLQAPRWPIDHEPVDVPGRGAVQVDDQPSVPPAGRERARRAQLWVQRQLWRGRVLVPGHELGALGRVRRGDHLADHRVEQRRFARFDLARDGDPKRGVDPVQFPAQPPLGFGRAPVRLDGALEQPAGGRREV